MVQLNIEQLFIHLKLQWQAPSPKTAQGFTQLSHRLTGLMTELQSSQSLEFLDKQFYPEWRVLNPQLVLSTIDPHSIFSLPETADEFRQGFYFCNRLIQLMEDAYLDLELESYWDHPDNRGWINLFRHWSWSAMFQACWTISACTYGIRFQRFCQRHLNLVLGLVSTCSLAFDQVDDSSLNALEQLQVKALYDIYQARCPHLQLYLLNLKIQPPLPQTTPQSPSLFPAFNFGYAMIDSHKKTLLMFRIQDHLRKLGLGNTGLFKLISEQANIYNQSLTLESSCYRYFKLTTGLKQITCSEDDKTLSTLLNNPLFNRDINRQSVAQFLRMLDSIQVRMAAMSHRSFSDDDLSSGSKTSGDYNV